MSGAKTLNADCRFCGAFESFADLSPEQLKTKLREWLKLHSPCSQGREIRLDIWPGKEG